MVSSPVRVAPLDDDDLLAAVQSAFREVILPELERLGAEEFTLSQVRSTLSMVSFVRRGLAARLLAQADAERQMADALRRRGVPPDQVSSPTDLAAAAEGMPELAALMRARLRWEIDTRTATPGPP
jgi:hypothetical protein